MPEWIHNREKHLKDKNPSMPESEAWAIATQQSHATGHTPKGYGTAEGKHEAKEKFDKPKHDYVQTANPKTAGVLDYAGDAARRVGRKLTNADTVENLAEQTANHAQHIQQLQRQVQGAKTLAGGIGLGAVGVHEMNKRPAPPTQPGQVKAASVVDGYSLAMFAGFSDEMQKIARAVGEAVKTFGHYLAGGPRLMPPIAEGAEHLVDSNLFPRVGSGLKALKNPETRSDALKVLGARGAVGGAGLGIIGGLSAHHKNVHQRQLQEAYQQGAQDIVNYQYAPNQET